MHLLNHNKANRNKLAKLNYHTFNSFCVRDIEFNSRNSIRAKSIFAYYIFYYITNNLF